MKYFAIIKDSLREALDSTVLYVMIGLSTLVILFVATLSFRPLPAEKTMKSLVEGTFRFLPEKMNPEFRTRRPGIYHLEKVDLLHGEADSPDSDYRLLISMAVANQEAADEVREKPQAEQARINEHFAPMVASGLIKVSDVRLATEQPPKDMATKVLFEVLTQPNAGTPRIWHSEPSLFFGAVPLSDLDLPLGVQLFFLISLVIFFGSLVAILGGVIITSFFIPNMLRKGTVDLLLVKPIHRWTLLLYKFIGGLTFIFVNNAYALLGMWLVLGLRSGIWANWSLLLIFILTFFFAILYAVSTLVAVLTRSTVTAILVTIGAWFVFYLVGTAHQWIERKIHAEVNLPEEQRPWTNNVAGKIVAGVHTVLPRTADLNHLGDLVILSDFVTGSWEETRKLEPSPIEWGESLLVSGLFIGILLGVACWWFSTKDY